MGVTVDLIPRLPGETPEHAIARIYDDGIAIVFDGDDRTVRIEDIGNGVEPAPPGAFDEWRAEAIRRVEALHHWQSEEIGGFPHFWSTGFGWQVEFNSKGLTLRWRGANSIDPDAPSLDDATLLAAFDGLHTVLHWPDAYGSYCDLDDPDDVPSCIG